MDCPKCYDEGKGLRQMNHKYEKGANVCFCNCGKEVITGFGIIR